MGTSKVGRALGMFAVGSWMLVAAPALGQDDMAGSDMPGSDMAMEHLEGVLGVAMHQVLGAYLVDAEGRTLYVVVDEDGAPVACAGACAEEWPPLLAPAMSDEGMNESGLGDGSMGEGSAGDEAMGDGSMGEEDTGEGETGEDPMDDDAMAAAMVDASLVGTVDRADGTTQVTFAGFPLYYFVNDVQPGEVTCQAVVQFGGTWFVLAPDGAVVRTSLTAGP